MAACVTILAPPLSLPPPKAEGQALHWFPKETRWNYDQLENTSNLFWSTMVSIELRSNRLEAPATSSDFILMKSFSLPRAIFGVRWPYWATEKMEALNREW